MNFFSKYSTDPHYYAEVTVTHKTFTWLSLMVEPKFVGKKPFLFFLSVIYHVHPGYVSVVAISLTLH